MAAPDVERAQRIDHGAYALLVFALPLLGSALLEVLASLLAERYPRPRVAGGALLGLGAALGLCAAAESSAALSLDLALAGTASGVACSVAQAELVAEAPAAPERAMTRWVLFGELGDALTPLLTALAMSFGGSFRAVFSMAAALAVGHALLLLGWQCRRPAWAADSDRAESAGEGMAACAAEVVRDAPPLPLLQALRESVRNRALWLWLLAAALCTFLDELVIALGTLHAERDLGASPTASVACATGAALGAALGALVTERLLLSVIPDRVLLGSAGLTLVALAALVLAPSLPALGVALGVLGAAAAPQYALLQAKAFAAEPGRPGVVSALGQVFVVIDIVGPLALGALADRAGLPVALAALSLQPLGVLAVLIAGARQRPR